MSKEALHITNGDSTTAIMQQAGITGTMLPWRDVLHEGPVPAGQNLEQLSETRARFIASRNWASYESVHAFMSERDTTLKSYRDFSSLTLWFEHDLYDQLQLIQILDWLADNFAFEIPLKLICIDQYLGMLSPDQMRSLEPLQRDVTQEQLTLAQRAWDAFRQDTPEDWYALLQQDTSALPFLRDAILRLLEEYPCTCNGLSRTELEALSIIQAGESRPGRIFGQYQESEERRFMGDSSFWQILHGFLDADTPLLSLPPGKSLTLPTSPDQTLNITEAGEAVLRGEKNWLELHTIDKWFGGVHITSTNTWYWKYATQEIGRKPK